MSLFARQENDLRFLEEANKTGSYYRVKHRLGVSLASFLTNDGLSFIVVRRENRVCFPTYC